MLAIPGTVGGTRCRGVKISSFSCLTYTTILVSGGGNTFLLLGSGCAVLTEFDFKMETPPPVAIAGPLAPPARPAYDW